MSVPKTAVQRLEKWKMVLAQYEHIFMHSSGERNCWRDLLSRWVNVPAVDVRAAVVFASSAPDETTPPKDTIREVRQQATAGLSAMVSGAFSFTTAVGHTTTTRISFACGWMVETGCGSRNEQRKCRRASWYMRSH